MATKGLDGAVVEYELGGHDSKALIEIQRAVGDLLIATLEQIGEAKLSYWEKEQLAFGINAYLANVHAWAPSSFGLRLALQAIDNAQIPAKDRGNDPPENEEVARITFAELLAAARAGRGRV